MDVCQNGVDCNKELWPIEHPVEPPDEDQPVKCPMPHTSLVNEWFSDSMRKRTDISAVMNEEGMMVVAAEPPAQAVRKRHHTSTHEDRHTLTPLLRMPPLHPFPTHSITIFQMLHQFNKFES
ncbi:uncharacterized protein LOC114316070 [Camellia sinensis]|uniref:uncharacterized protein LOC114316070 n=1 Tax=Camellia sinensis TaxID=4442 RepID=UPI0010367E22|nr:uncharacterized protein LOC114316070 [Camellia sinensis]